MLALVVKFVARSVVTSIVLAWLLLAMLWVMPPARRPTMVNLLPQTSTSQVAYLLYRAEWTVRHAFLVVDSVAARVYSDQDKVWQAR